MHIADVDQGMLGANGIDMLAVPIGQIAAVSTGDGAVTIEARATCPARRSPGASPART